jgi:hypothetical protein
MKESVKITSISLKNKKVVPVAIFNFDVGLETENFGGLYLKTQKSYFPKLFHYFSNISIQISKIVAVLKWNYQIGRSILGIYKSLTDT